MENRSRHIQSLERAMALLEALREQGGEARLADLAQSTGLSRSTVHGLLDTLVTLGYVSRAQTRYSLGLRLHHLAEPLDGRGAALRQSFAPALRAFAELCGERCYLAVPAGTRGFLTLAALDGQGRPLAPQPAAARAALSTSAIGKVLLAHDRSLLRRLRRDAALPDSLEGELQQVGRQGFALDLQGSERDLNCVALPLRLRGQVVAALGAGGPASSLSPALMQRLAGRAMRELFDLIKC